MNLKTYQADSMQEALAKVREELGDDAVIVKTRQTSRKLLGKSKTCYEVTAAVERPLAAKDRPDKESTKTVAVKAATPGANAPAPKTGAYDWTGRLPRISTQAEAPQPLPDPVGSGLNDLRAEIEKVRSEAQMPTREMRLLRDEIQAMLESASTPAPVHNGPAALQALDLSPVQGMDLWQRASEMPEAKNHPACIPDLVAHIMADDLRCAGGIRLKGGRPTRVLISGPTGSGKSSLVQKLAAQARLAGKRVGILSADPRRMGAHGELTLFAKTLGLPIACVFDAREIPPALYALRGCELILADAPFTPAGEKGWSELQALRQALEPDETHLVLNACMRERELKRAVQGSSRLRPTHLSFTRLDECLGFGALYATARAFPGFLGYLISGPAASGNIEAASPHSLQAWFRRGLEPTPTESMAITH